MKTVKTIKEITDEADKWPDYPRAKLGGYFNHQKTMVNNLGVMPNQIKRAVNQQHILHITRIIRSV